jgi:hypothetical protein
MRRFLFALSLATVGLPLLAQPLPPEITAGMGVNYASMGDVIDLANATTGATDRLSEFQSGVEFFLHAGWPLNEDWILALDYAYQITSVTVPTVYAPAQYTVTLHAPALVLKRILMAEPLYHVTAGLGLGYDAGALQVEHLYVDDRFTASGPALLLLLEGNTSLGGSTYAYMGVTARWSSSTPLQNGEGQGPGAAAGETTLSQFSIGARLGMTFAL